MAHTGSRNSEQSLIHPIYIPHMCVRASAYTYIYLSISTCVYIYLSISVCVYACIERNRVPVCLPLLSSLLMAPNQAAADLTNLFGMARSTVAACSEQSTALTQGDTCKLSAESGSFPSTGTVEMCMGPEPPSQAVSEELPLAPLWLSCQGRSCRQGQGEQDALMQGVGEPPKAITCLPAWGGAC